MTTITTTTATTSMTAKYFFKSIKYHIFSESQAQADLSDDDDNNDDDNNNDKDDNNNNNNKDDNDNESISALVLHRSMGFL